MGSNLSNKNARASVMSWGGLLAIVTGLAQPCGAIEFDLTFYGDSGLWGTGEVTAVDYHNGTYLATSGSVNLTGGPYNPFSGTLVPTAGHGLWWGGGPTDFEASLYGGTYIGYDDLIVKTGSTYSLTDWGLLFNDPGFAGDAGPGMAWIPWAGLSGFNGYDNSPWFDVEHTSVTITPVSNVPNITPNSSVPDGGWTGPLLGIGMFALGLVRRTVK